MIYYIVNILLVLFHCLPPSKTFNRSKPGTSFNNDASLVVNGVFVVLSDFAILMLPVFWIWKIQIPVRRRLGVLIIFSVALM